MFISRYYLLKKDLVVQDFIFPSFLEYSSILGSYLFCVNWHSRVCRKLKGDLYPCEAFQIASN